MHSMCCVTHANGHNNINLWGHKEKCEYLCNVVDCAEGEVLRMVGCLGTVWFGFRFPIYAILTFICLI